MYEMGEGILPLFSSLKFENRPEHPTYYGVAIYGGLFKLLALGLKGGPFLEVSKGKAN